MVRVLILPPLSVKQPGERHASACRYENEVPDGKAPPDQLCDLEHADFQEC